MIFLEKVVEHLGTIDGLKGVADAIYNVYNADNTTEQTAAISQLAAEIAVGSIIVTTLRPAFVSLRLGLAVSGKIGQWEALTKVLGVVGGISAGQVIDMINDIDMGSKLYDWFHPDTAIRDNFTAAQNPPRKDPLILDLGDDGLQTIAASSTNPILFDHDGDGIKTGTGWIGSEDAFLVLDRNNNGLIDNGSELFGDSTPLATGGTAADGYAALAQCDTNHDGVVNSIDANWIELRLWKDLNQDAISQSNELFTLEELGVSGLSIERTVHNRTLPDGNQLADLGTFSRYNGIQGTMATVGRMADINLIDDTFHRTFPDRIPLAEGVAELPEMQGSGMVRDLREAASLSPQLKDILSQYTHAPSREAQLALLDALLSAWADTSGLLKTLQERLGSPGDPGVYRVASYLAFGDQKIEQYTTRTNHGTSILQPEWKEIIKQWEHKIHILEAFNGRYFIATPDETTNGTTPNPGLGNGSGGGGGGGGIAAPPSVRVSLTTDQTNLLNQAYAALRESIYDSLLLQTRLKAPIEQIGLIIDEDEMRLDIAPVIQYFDDAIARNAKQGMTDLIEFNKAAASLLTGTDWNGLETIAHYARTLPVTPELTAVYDEFNILLTGESGLLQGSDASEMIIAGDEDSDIQAGSGNDSISGGNGFDILDGGKGNDILIGGKDNDAIYGGPGSDTYIFSRGDGQDQYGDKDDHANTNDTLKLVGISPDETFLIEDNADLFVFIKGTTDRILLATLSDSSHPWWLDRLQFDDGTVWDAPTIQNAIQTGTSNDTYVFAKGDGQDTIYDDDYGNSSQIDTLQLVGIAPDEVTLYRNDIDWQISVEGTTDRISMPYAGIDCLQFDDSTVWDISIMKSKLSSGKAIVEE